jgi:mRNA-degrading endonuclease RelE of RelBE toxin-antitoxin system
MSNEEDEYISEELAKSIRAGLSEENLAVYSPEEAIYVLKAKWENRPVENILFARDYDWDITFTSEFDKKSSRLDKNLKGKILEAIIEISRDPMTVKGRIKKPLKHEWKGQWDYQTRGFRVIYEPDPKTKNVRLVTVGPRSSVYKIK